MACRARWSWASSLRPPTGKGLPPVRPVLKRLAATRGAGHKPPFPTFALGLIRIRQPYWPGWSRLERTVSLSPLLRDHAGAVSLSVGQDRAEGVHRAERPPRR